MKNLLFLILIYFLSFTGAAQVENFMEEGNRYYQQSQFSDAITSYNKILQQNFESSALYYNLGNAYYKTGNLGRAILNYEKGLKLSPGDEDLQYNLEVAKARTVDRINEVPKLFIVEWWESLITLFSASGWAFIVSLLFILFLIFAASYFFVKSFNIQRILFILGAANIFALIFAVILLVAQIDRETSVQYGVLLENNITAKISPDEKGNDAFVVHEGIKFEIQDQLNDWAKIKLADGKVGWLPKSTFGTI